MSYYSELLSNYYLINLQKYIISQHQNQNQDLKIEDTLFAHTRCTE